MRRLQNTLYVTSEDTYLSLDGENVVVRSDNAVIGRVPLHNLENIVSFGYRGASPRLMSACAERGVGLCFLSAHGRFRSCSRQCFASDHAVSYRLLLRSIVHC